jgi:outer membrane protein TolC
MGAGKTIGNNSRLTGCRLLKRQALVAALIVTTLCTARTGAQLQSPNDPRALPVNPPTTNEAVIWRRVGEIRTNDPLFPQPSQQPLPVPAPIVSQPSQQPLPVLAPIDPQPSQQPLVQIPKAAGLAPTVQPMPVPLPAPQFVETPKGPTGGNTLSPVPPTSQSQIDRQLPINLATALRLSDARPLMVAVAQTRVQLAAAQLEKAKALWLPNLNVGSAYMIHGDGNQTTSGVLTTPGTGFLYAGASLEVRFAATDAIFEPLSARQELRARKAEVQAAKNSALMSTAEAYFNVQQARGTYSGMVDAVEKGRELVKRVESLAKGLAAPDEIERSRALLAELEQSAATSFQQWRVASANLTRVLRLDPGAFVVPLEPDHLQVTLITPNEAVDDLIPVGLTSRPELESFQAIVQATLVRLKQERLRPLIPSVLITGNGTPDFLYQAGVFGTGSGAGSLNQWAGRVDVSFQLVWKLDNLGYGYKARKGLRCNWPCWIFTTFRTPWLHRSPRPKPTSTRRLSASAKRNAVSNRAWRITRAT